MARDINPAAARIEARRVILVADLAGFTRAVGPLDTTALAELVHRFYTAAATRVEDHGGRVVKFIGDGCLALFDEDAAPAAVACAHELGASVRELGAEWGIALDVGANVHMATIVEGEYGAGRSAAFDVIGAGVMHAFRMGAGPGIRISEPVFRRLPNDQRRAWQKRQPPATYTWGGSA
jgi:class 3 adenylate cyclase